MYFLQISDTHYLQDYHTNQDFFHPAFLNLQPLKEKLRSLQQMIRKPVDFICHCGDVSHWGQREDLQQVKDMLEEIFPGVPVLVTPGNHDQKDLVQQVFYGEVTDFFCYDQMVGNLRILSFDNSNGRAGTGEISEKTARWLLEKCQENPDQDIILMSHHHVLEQQSTMPPLEACPLFQELLFQKNILAYLTGHSHVDYVGKLEDLPYYTVGSLCFQTEDLGQGLLAVQESSCYHLFSHSPQQVRLEQAGDLGFSSSLGQVQRP